MLHGCAAGRQVAWQWGSRVVNLESRLRWVLLVPGGPMRWTASARLMNCNPASARTRIERRLEGEVKSGERLHRRQLSHFDAAVFAHRKFFGEQRLRRLRLRHVRYRAG